MKEFFIIFYAIRTLYKEYIVNTILTISYKRFGNWHYSVIQESQSNRVLACECVCVQIQATFPVWPIMSVSYSTAAVTNDQKFSGLKHTNVLFYGSKGQKNSNQCVRTVFLVETIGKNMFCHGS